MKRTPPQRILHEPLPFLLGQRRDPELLTGEDLDHYKYAPSGPSPPNISHVSQGTDVFLQLLNISSEFKRTSKIVGKTFCDNSVVRLISNSFEGFFNPSLSFLLTFYTHTFFQFIFLFLPRSFL